MTLKYWLKILLGMLAIFTGGMFVAKGVEAGKRKVVGIVDSASPISIPLFGMPFRTNRGELGALQRLRVERSAPRMVDGFHLSVTLNEGIDVDQFDGCEITVSDPEEIDEHTTFDCLTPADSGFDALVQFGTITFSPSGEVHRLMIPEQQRDEIRNAFSTDEATLISDSMQVDSTADGSLTVEINGQRVVDIRADSAGGSVQVVDPKSGRKVVDIKSN
jgi:hypothetical protein